MAGDLSKPNKFTDKVKQRYLRVLTETGRKYASAKACGVCGQTVKDHRKIDPVFAADEEAAMDLYRDHLEEEVYRRAVQGVPEPIYQGGKRVLEVLVDDDGNVLYDAEGKPRVAPAIIRKYSDKLLELHTKRHIPEYRDRHTIDLNAKGGVLVVPGQQQDVDWEAQYGGEKVIEGEVIPDDTKRITRG